MFSSLHNNSSIFTLVTWLIFWNIDVINFVILAWRKFVQYGMLIIHEVIKFKFEIMFIDCFTAERLDINKNM